MLKGILHDLLYAARSLAKAPAFTFVCIASLGIGMVPVIAVPYLARIPHTPPPHVNTDRLVELITTATATSEATNNWSYPDFLDLRSANTGATIFAWVTAPNEITLPGGEKTVLWPMYVSSGYFQTLGVPLARGTGFESESAPAVILSYQFWKDRLASDPQIIGKTIRINNVPHTVSGIAPDQFQGHLGLQGRELFVPLERHPLLQSDPKARLDRAKEWLHLHGRLAQGTTVAQASAAVAGITARLAKEYPSTNNLRAGLVEAYDPLGVLDRSRFLVMEAIAMTLTGAVLLIVCLNLSGMMQVRSALRERELSIRQAIGAGRLRLARLLLAEALLLATAGGALASIVIFNAPTVFSRLSGQPIPPPLENALKLDLSIVAICIGICLVASLVFGFLSALRFSRPVIISALKDDAGAGGIRAGRVHRFTAALQVAIAVPLLVMGAIGLDRVRSAASYDLGFESGLIYAAPIELSAGPQADNPAALDFKLRSLRETLSNASGVVSATIADGLPLDFRARPANVSLDPNSPTLRAQLTRVSDGYLNTMGIPLLTGRGFSNDDTAGSEQVTVISKTLAGRLFPTAPPTQAIGKKLTIEKPPQTLTIIGVTKDFPASQITTERSQLLVPIVQNARPNTIATDEDGNRLPNLFLIARSAPGEQPEKITTALVNVVRELDPEFRRERILTGTSLRKRTMDDLLTGAAVAGAAGSIVLMLSALGIYGVVGLMVAARTREIAVRVALGASRPRVLGMILFDVIKLTAPGIAVGLLLTAAVTRLNPDKMGIPLSSVEPLAYIAGAAIAILVALIASLIPARRAASVMPMVAMRTE